VCRAALSGHLRQDQFGTHLGRRRDGTSVRLRWDQRRHVRAYGLAHLGPDGTANIRSLGASLRRAFYGANGGKERSALELADDDAIVSTELHGIGPAIRLTTAYASEHALLVTNDVGLSDAVIPRTVLGAVIQQRAIQYPNI
jgi:hypothetical protein